MIRVSNPDQTLIPGAFVSVPLFSSFYLQPEILYSGQGATFTNSLANGKLQYGYLNIPVLFKYQHSSGLIAETGPQTGFLLSTKDIVNGQSGNIMAYSGFTNVNKDKTSGTTKISLFNLDYSMNLENKIVNPLHICKT